MYIVFLPAYNEESALPILVRKFHVLFKRVGVEYEIVVLDDGSTDRTKSECFNLIHQNYPVRYFRHEKNQGLGMTMLHGLKNISNLCHDEDIIITMDADDTHDPVYCLEASRQLKDYDVAILSRYIAGGREEGLSKMRSLLSRGAGLFLKLMFPIKGVHEYSCGYRVFTGKILKQSFDIFGDKFIQLHKWGFVVTPEILIKWRMLGAMITEVPFTLHYDQKKGASKNRPMRTIAGYLMLVLTCFGRKA